jgi:hypothetical protein
MGATATILATNDVATEISAKSLGPIDITIECSGAEVSIKTAIQVLHAVLGVLQIRIGSLDNSTRRCCGLGRTRSR